MRYDARNFVKFRRFGPFFGEGGKRRIPRNSIVADCARVDLRARRAPRASPWRAGVETVMIVVKTQHSPMKTTGFDWAVSHHSLYCCYMNIDRDTDTELGNVQKGQNRPFRTFRGTILPAPSICTPTDEARVYVLLGAYLRA